jgi:hypothetical protein
MPKGNSPYLHLLADAKEIVSTLVDLLVDLGYAVVYKDNTFSFTATARKRYSSYRTEKTGLQFQPATQRSIEKYFNAVIKSEPIEHMQVEISTLNKLCLRAIGCSVTNLEKHHTFKNKNLNFSLQEVDKSNPVIPNRFSEPREALEYFITHTHIKPHDPVVISGILISDRIIKNWESFAEAFSTYSLHAIIAIQDSSGAYIDEIARRVETTITKIRYIEQEITKLSQTFLRSKRKKNSSIVVYPSPDLIADFYQGVFCIEQWSAIAHSLQSFSNVNECMLDLRRKDTLEKLTQEKVSTYFSLH